MSFTAFCNGWYKHGTRHCVYCHPLLHSRIHFPSVRRILCRGKLGGGGTLNHHQKELQHAVVIKVLSYVFCIRPESVSCQIVFRYVFHISFGISRTSTSLSDTKYSTDGVLFILAQGRVYAEISRVVSHLYTYFFLSIFTNGLFNFGL